MADLTVTAAQVAVVFPEDAEIRSVILAETVTAGQPLFQNTSGKYELADANAAGEQQVRYLSLEGGGAGQAISALRRGEVYGFALSGVAYDAMVQLSNTVGVLDSGGSPTLVVPVGIVTALTDNPTLTKVLYWNPRQREDFA